MTHGSLFSGIGGFDLAAEWMGWENKFHCEWDEFCQKVLKKHFPKSVSYGDITTTDFKKWNSKIDIVSGGFPCQPYSAAGKRKGKEDHRHLWPEMLRAIREIQPAWVVGENVHGLLNWNRGMVLTEIKADLEASGFEVFPPVVLPACGKNAPHRRERLWVIAHSNSNRFCENQVQPTKHTEKHFWEYGRQFRLLVEEARLPKANTRINGNNNGLPNGLDECRIKALGNSVVPQVVFEIFKAIESMELINRTESA